MNLLSACDRYFAITERGSNFAQEIRGGVVAFFTVAYIIVLNPIVIGGTPGNPKNEDILHHILPMSAVAAGTACIAGIMTIFCGIYARYPFVISTGLGFNNLLAISVISQTSWPEAMGLVVLDGLIIVFLVVSGIRTAVFNAIPPQLKSAIAVGIGCFITFVGLVDGGIIHRIPDQAHTSVPVELGNKSSLSTIPTLIFVCGLVMMIVLMVKNVRGSFLIGIFATTIIAIIIQHFTQLGPMNKDKNGWSLNIPELPHHIVSMPDLSLLGRCNLLGAFHRLGIMTATLIIFTLVLTNFFDAMGTISSLTQEAGLAEASGAVPNLGKALFVDGCGAIAGGFGSVSSDTVCVESAAGIAEGARTGLAPVVTGILFLVAMFATPLYSIVPSEAADPALVIVGALMMIQIKNIDFRQFDSGFPCFLTIVVMPFTYSIANGIGIGCIFWVICALVSGKAKTLHPLLVIVSGLFILYFGRGIF